MATDADSNWHRPTLGDRIIRWGLIAGGVTAIVGLGVLVWDKLNADPPAKLGAHFESLAIEHGVTFGDFEGQQKLGTAARGPGLVLASALVAQATPTAEPADETPTATTTPTATCDGDRHRHRHRHRHAYAHADRHRRSGDRPARRSAPAVIRAR